MAKTDILSLDISKSLNDMFYHHSLRVDLNFWQKLLKLYWCSCPKGVESKEELRSPVGPGVGGSGEDIQNLML